MAQGWSRSAGRSISSRTRFDRVRRPNDFVRKRRSMCHMVPCTIWDSIKYFNNIMCKLALVAEWLQLVLPGALARYLPILLFGQHLEDAVLSGLVPVVIAIVLGLFPLDLLILLSTDQSVAKQICAGTVGLVLGSLVFHVIIVMFGAPVVDLWRQTLLLAILLSSCVTMPLAVHFGCAPRQWLDPLLDLRMSNLQELYLVCSSMGAIIGAYVGALPIPLDWDRPWQQWPLTCVYGTLTGHAAGTLVSIVTGATSSAFASRKTKKAQ